MRARRFYAQAEAEGRRLFVVTNKPRHISLKILEAGETLELFEEVITKDSRNRRIKTSRR